MKNLFEERIPKNFPNLGKKTGLQAQEALPVPNKRNPKSFTPRHNNKSKMKEKRRILKAEKKKRKEKKRKERKSN